LFLQLEIGDDHFIELGLAFLAVDALGSGDVLDIIALVEFEDFRIIIIGKDEPALDVLEDVSQCFVTELLGVLIGIAKHVRWITIEEVALGIILIDHLLIGEVLNDHHVESFVEFFNAFQSVIHTGCTTLLRGAEAVTLASEATSDQIHEPGSPLYLGKAFLLEDIAKELAAGD